MILLVKIFDVSPSQSVNLPRIVHSLDTLASMKGVSWAVDRMRIAIKTQVWAIAMWQPINVWLAKQMKSVQVQRLQCVMKVFVGLVSMIPIVSIFKTNPSVKTLRKEVFAVSAKQIITVLVPRLRYVMMAFVVLVSMTPIVSTLMDTAFALKMFVASAAKTNIAPIQRLRGVKKVFVELVKMTLTANTCKASSFVMTRKSAASVKPMTIVH